MLEAMLMGQDNLGKVLLHFNGGLKDTYGHAVSVIGTVNLNPTGRFYGSVTQGSSTSMLLIAAADDLVLSGDFTAEMWFGGALGSGANQLVFGNDGLHLQILGNRAYFYDASGALFGPSETLASPGTTDYTHCAWTREGDTWRFFWGGVLALTGTSSAGDAVAKPLGVGNAYTGSFGMVNNSVSEFRLTNNRALYTASFIPPTSPFKR